MSAKYFTDDHAEHVLKAKFATRAIHAGQHPDPVTGAVIPPLSLSTTFKQHGAGEHNYLPELQREEFSFAEHGQQQQQQQQQS
ncbi:hypothetical protein BGZ50_002333 [Haplosporangium sp. Z 11]|nr:hypothetical protein BGZ50_002333 [Haplosporangium sp. Z 11]